MKIVKLQVANVMRLKVVEINPNGTLNIIRGNNANGKTSLLRSIQMAFGGKRAQPEKVIRQGEREASIVLETETLIIERRWTAETEAMAAGESIEVRTKDGTKKTSPQKVLDALKSELTFNPLLFMRQEPKVKRELLRKLLKLDFSEADAKRQNAYDVRTQHNRKVVDLDGEIKAIHPDKVTAINVDALLAEQKRLEGSRLTQEKARSAFELATMAVDQLKNDAKATAEAIAQHEAAIAKLRVRAQQLAEKTAAAETNLASQEIELDAMEPVDKALEQLREKISAAGQVNERARAYEKRQALAAKREVEAEASVKLSAEITRLDDWKAEQLAAAKFPVPGLSFSDEGVTFQGLPIEQASGAEQLRVSVAIGLALNPELRILLIEDASLLDANGIQLVAEMAAKADAQVWLECVGDEGVGIVIEDGEVRAAS